MKLNGLRKRFRFRITGHTERLSVAVLLLLFAVIGPALFIASHAATSAIAAEPELGTPNLPASIGNDTTGSGGQYVKFSDVTTPPVGSANPCVGAAAPASWNHIVVLMFENKSYSEVIGTAASYITGLAAKCGTYTSWKDANYKVNGTTDGTYNSKPHYATLTNGLPASVTGFVDDNYLTAKNFDNIFNRLHLMGKDTRSYIAGPSNDCATRSFSGEYHDPMRYYTNLGGRSSQPTTYCNTHDVNMSAFMTDVNAGRLPAFSIILPTNQQNMHDNTIASGDAWAHDFLTPFLDSARYKSGDTALFFLWDEDTPVPNVLVAPSVRSGSQPVAPSPTQPIGHYTALRTWQEMLGISPFLGDSSQASSLLNFYNGR
jgi:phospholipase C